MQWKVFYKEDIKQLRSALASHFAAINILLMTQADASILLAENERDAYASTFGSKILAHSQLLGNIDNSMEKSLEQQEQLKKQLHDQKADIKQLNKTVDKTHDLMRN